MDKPLNSALYRKSISFVRADKLLNSALCVAIINHNTGKISYYFADYFFELGESKEWLGCQDSNLGMRRSKPRALPLGDIPIILK